MDRMRIPPRFLIVLCLLVAGSATRLESQQPALSPEQQRVYDVRQLAVEAVGGGSRAGAGGAAWAASWTRWNAFEGSNRISEGEFFRRAGFPRQAALADEWRRSGRAPMGWGIAMCAAGVGLMIAGVRESDWSRKVTGLTVGAAGLGLAVPAWQRLRQNRLPLATAEGIADAYNAGLRERILRGEVR